MIDWNNRVQEWANYNARLEYRDIPIDRLQDVVWEKDGVYLLLPENKRARISHEALYELFVLCQKLRWSGRVRVAVPLGAFEGTQASYRSLIRDVLMALWKHNEHDYGRTSLRSNPPRALFEKKDGKATIVGIAPPHLVPVPVPDILQLCNPERADWSYWGERGWDYKDIAPSGLYQFSWFGWEEREFRLTHHISYWLLERDDVFVRFFCGYTGKIGTGAHIGAQVKGKRINIISLGNVIATNLGYSPDWKVKRAVKTLGMAWKLCFYGPLLDTVAQLRGFISTELINNNIKQGITKGIIDELKSLEKSTGVSFGSLSLERVSDASTFGDFVAIASDELMTGANELQQIYAERILGKFVVRIVADGEAGKRTRINRWRSFLEVLLSDL